MRPLQASLVVLLLTSVSVVPSSAQRQTAASPPLAPAALLDHLTGHWVMRGVIAKQQTTHDIDARWILNKEYVQIHEVSREMDASHKPQYEALIHVVWEPKAAEYACIWFDTTGISLFAQEGVGRAKPAGDAIPFIFKDPNGDTHTTFAYDRAKDAWTWTIDNDVKGQLSPFARLTLTRQ